VSTRAERAAAAAASLARRWGVPADDAVVLHDGMNAVVHLRPAPVVARVATLTPLLRDGDRAFAREVALAGALAAAGAPVVPPSDLLPPGPHAAGGQTVSFWRFAEVLPDRPSAGDAGRALAALHEVLAGIDPGWDGAPLDTPLEDLARFGERGAALGADPALARRVAELAGELAPELGGELGPGLGGELGPGLGGPATALHGDAHPGNLLATPQGWRWADLEDTCRGPRAWDLACLRATSRLDGRAALDAVPGAPDDAELAPWLDLRRLHGAAWWFVHAVRVPADLPVAHERLRGAVERVSASLAGRRPGRG
jgi:Phosphotransferase enzyme family